jgi:LysM repeat protein
MDADTETSHAGHHALDEFCLSNIFLHLPAAVLLELRLASRASKQLADAILHVNFMRRWGVASIQGQPSVAALATADLRHFVFQHTVERHDTLAGIALRHNADPHVLRRINNVLSERTLASRTHIFVPGR